MDNARDGAQVEQLLPPPACLLLITSRQHFHLPGLHAADLEALTDSDAHDLLTTIAPRLNTLLDGATLSLISFVSLPKDKPEIKASAIIARLCANLPLALRLAASALAERPDLTPADLIRRLDDAQTRLKLTGVEASLTLSWGLLTPAQGSAFCALSVFPDSFDRAAATAVLNLQPDPALDVLSDLVRHSLLDFLPSPVGAVFDRPTGEGPGVRVGGEGRYRLHDLTHLFASTSLPETERYEAQKRHSVHFADLLSKANQLYLKGGDSVKQGLSLFDLEWTNIEAGQAWAAENSAKGDVAAGLCSAFPDWPYLLELRLHPRERIRWLEAALAAARILKHRQAEGAHLGNLGLAYADLGETRKAIEFYEQGLAVAREIGDRRNEGACLGNLGLAYYFLGETRKAIEFYEQALVIDREIGDRRGEGADLGNLGLAYAALGETRKAIEFYELDLTIAREIGDRRGEGADLGNLGLAYAALGETRKAIEFYEQDLILAREIGDRRVEGNGLMNIGNAHYSLGETRKAIEYHEQAVPIFREIGDRRGEGYALWNMSLSLDKLGEGVRAIACAEAALKIYEEIEDPHAERVRKQLAGWREEGGKKW
jgi:tetratricopeptide (TPR) repeat protein